MTMQVRPVQLVHGAAHEQRPGVEPALADHLALRIRGAAAPSLPQREAREAALPPAGKGNV